MERMVSKNKNQRDERWFLFTEKIWWIVLDDFNAEITPHIYVGTTEN